MPSSRAKGEVGPLSLLVVCASVLHACDHAPSEEPAAICDGTSSIRLLAQTVTSEAQLLPGYQLLYENGAIYLLVDGKCHYWSFAGGAWSGVREGALSESAARSLSEALDYSEWPRSKGVWNPTLVPSDASALVLRGSPLDGGAVVCVGCGAAGSSVPGLPDAMARAFSNVQPETERLWDAGTNVAGPVWYVLASEPAYHSQDPHLEWPAQVGDAARLAISYSDAFTLRFFDPRFRRLEGAQAEALRALRERRFTDPLYRNFEWIPVRDTADAGYWLFVRDSIPAEDPEGRL